MLQRIYGDENVGYVFWTDDEGYFQWPKEPHFAAAAVLLDVADANEADELRWPANVPDETSLGNRIAQLREERNRALNALGI